MSNDGYRSFIKFLKLIFSNIIIEKMLDNIKITSSENFHPISC